MNEITNEHLDRGYAPLPQHISTDTEEDDEHHDRLNHLETTEMISQNVIRKNGRYFPLDETQNLANRYRNERNNASFCTDDIPIMVIDDATNDLWKRNEVTPLRRFFSVVAVLACTLIIAIFIYGLPCDDSLICPQTKTSKSFKPWSRNLDGVELHGPISIIPGTQNNLIFLLRGQQYADEHSKITNREQIPSKGGGVLSMQGNSGTRLWWIPLERLPTDINCMILDTDDSGKADCLVAGRQGLLASIEPTAGTIHWVSTLNTYPKLPILIPDINGDDIDDLLSVENNSSIVNLVLLSGNNGQLLSRRNTACRSVNLQNLGPNGTITYLCDDAYGKQSTQLVLLSQLIDTSNLPQKRKKTSYYFREDFANVSLSRQSDEDNWQLSPYYQLQVQNLGLCPGEKCRVVLNLTMGNSANESRSIWNYVSSKSFASKPAILNTTNQSYAAGFALKLWIWSEKNVASANSVPRSVEKRVWTERVFIFYMNHTEVRYINASQNEIIQLCQDEGNCQPNFKMQNDSIAIADFNDDGFWYLIDFTTSYNLTQPKTLLSTVQVVNLNTLL